MFRHKMAWWGLFIISLFAVWFGGWFALANFADNKIEQVTVQMTQNGVEIACDNRAIKGFPFRMGVKCDRLDVTDANSGARMESGAFRTTAVLYDPTKMIAEIDAPFKVAALGRELSATWDLMRLYVDGEISGNFELISLNNKNLSAILGELKFHSSEGAVHIRRTPEALQSLDIAANAVDISASVAGFLNIPTATISTDLTIVDGYQRLILARETINQFVSNGANVDIRSILLETGEGGKVSLAGPLQILPNGRLNGKVRIGIAKPVALKKWAAQISPKASQVIALAEQGISGMGVASKFGDLEMRSIEIRIDDGIVRLGFIKIAEIPSLTGF